MMISIIPLLLLISGCFVFTMGIWSLRYAKKTGAIPFIGLMFCSAIHSAGYAMELSSINLYDVFFWSGVQYIGIEFSPIFYLSMALIYTGLYNRGVRIPLVIMGIFAIATLAVHGTTEQHQLYYKDLVLHQDGSITILGFTKGPWYIANSVYINLSLLAGSILFLKYILRSANEYRKQALLMLTGSLFPWAGYVIYIAGYSPYNIDLTPVMFTVAAPLWAVALFRYRLLDLSPIARDFIFDSMSDGMIIIDPKGRLVDFNTATRRIIPGVRKKSVGKNISEILKPYPEIINILNSDCIKSNCEITREIENSEQHYRVCASPLLNRKKNEVGKIVALIDTTEQAQLMEKLQKLATTDELTGIANRREFLASSHREILRARRYDRACTLIMIDIDHFKNVNDTYGHSTGDRALIHVVDIVKIHIREIDIFGRYGGEEFTLLLPEIGPEQGFAAAERLRIFIENAPFRANGHSIKITASFGVTGGTGDCIDIENLLQKSDEALYDAKNSGRNRSILKL